MSAYLQLFDYALWKCQPWNMHFNFHSSSISIRCNIWIIAEMHAIYTAEKHTEIEANREFLTSISF